MSTLGFENYSDVLKVYLAKYRQVSGRARSQRLSRAFDSPPGEAAAAPSSCPWNLKLTPALRFTAPAHDRQTRRKEGQGCAGRAASGSDGRDAV